MIDNRQAHNHSLPFPYQRFQAIFLHRHITETGSLRSVNPTYTLYFKKNDEFRFVGLKFNDYTEDGELDNDDWEASYESCSCN